MPAAHRAQQTPSTGPSSTTVPLQSNAQAESAVAVRWQSLSPLGKLAAL